MTNIGGALKIMPPWTKPQELTWLGKQAGHCERILELGTYHGRSTRAMLDNSQAHIWCVDTWEGRITRSTTATDRDLNFFKANIEDMKDRVTILQMSTDLAVKQLRELEKFDLVFIDADHTYEWVRKDILAYGPLVKPNGLLCGHDYFRKAPGLIKAVDELLGDTHHISTIWWVRLKDYTWLDTVL